MSIARWTAVAALALAGGAASAATLKLKSVDGTVAGVQGDKVTLADSHGKRKELSLSSGTRWVAARPMAQDDVKPGDQVRVIYTFLADGSLKVLAMGLVASPSLAAADTSVYPDNWTGGSGSAMPSSPGTSQPLTVTGKVESVRGERITLRTTKKQAHELVVDADSRFIESRPLAKEDLKEGDRVRAFMNPKKGTQVLAIGAQPAVAAMGNGADPKAWTTGSGSAVPSVGSEESGEKP